jgi:predicted transcriptional regulator
VYHLQRLERHGLVVSVRQGGSRRYYACNTEAARHREALAALAHPTTRRVAEYVRSHAGTDQAGLCRALGLLNPAASKQLSRLESLGLVMSQRSGRSRIYWPTEPLEAAVATLPGEAVPAADVQVPA